MKHGTSYGYTSGCRCNACRAAHNERARRSGSNRRVGNRGNAKRQWDLENREVCACGRLIYRNRTTCRDCYTRERTEHKRERRSEIQRLWLTGLPVKDLAQALGSTPGSIGVEIVRMRNEGWELPYRRQVNTR